MSTPRISVLIDTYNHEPFIARAIRSAIEQDFPASETEILVVDDGSTDSTRETVRSFGGRVRLIAKTNGGQASAFNVGLREARGDLVAFLDGDDWWAPDKLRVVAEYFDAHPGVGVLGHGIEQVNHVIGEQVRTLPQDEREFSFSSAADAAEFRRMLCFFGTSRLAIRRDVAMRAWPVPEGITIQADEFLAIASAAHSRAAMIKAPLTFYRLHSDNLYQMQVVDHRKLRRMQRALEAMASALPSRLASAGVSADAILALTEPLANTAKRLRLRLDGGMPWETFAAERFDRNYAYAASSLGYHLYSWVSLGLTLVLPPRLYYWLRDRYAGSRVRRWRGLLGEPASAASIANIPAAALAGGAATKTAAIRST
jgi:hypothetical protein